MMESFIPIMPEAGRIINVGTSATRFMKFDNSELRRIVENKPDVKVCNQLAEDYVVSHVHDLHLDA